MTARGRLGIGVLLATLAAAATYVGYETWGPRHTPAGQPALRTLSSEDLDLVRSEFNTAAEKTRVLALFSPT